MRKLIGPTICNDSVGRIRRSRRIRQNDVNNLKAALIHSMRAVFLITA